MGKGKSPKPGGKPGQIASQSGQYGRRGPKGGKLPGEITVVQGKPFPPTEKPGQTFVLVDKTEHKDS